MNSSNMQFQQNMSTTIQDLKMQIGQLANTVSHLQSVGSDNLPLQTILNPRGNASIITLRSSRELPQIKPQQEPRLTGTDCKLDANSQVPQEKHVPLPFPTWTPTARKLEIDEELLRMFRKIPKYVKFLKKLCVHKRKKMKGGEAYDCTFADVMPTSIYKSLNFGDLKPTGMTI
ncbi:hypothetical protein CR513_10244, partial [Mucuna pruriens]